MINNKKANKQARSKHKQDVELFNIALVEAIESLPPPVDWSELPSSGKVCEDYMDSLYDKVMDRMGYKDPSLSDFEFQFASDWIEAEFKFAFYAITQAARDRKHTERVRRPGGRGRLLAFSRNS
jgi:hypothetical protein